MTLKQRIDEEIKSAMKAQNKDDLRALRAIKSLILLAETEEGSNGEVSAEKELQMLMKAAKQRKDSAEIYAQQGREDLRKIELDELAVIERFLPKMMSEEEVTEVIKGIITKVGATSAKEMGKVMGVATKELAGKADNKTISAVVKALLPA
ncbi:MAG: GatB/YqeY domain-containing protein [Thermoflexibacteraceae bacterium]|jgi:uncharacterized protein YqeY